MPPRVPEKRSTILTLLGPCPSKKNLWRRGKSGRMYIAAPIEAQIKALEHQAETQWKRGPVEHPDLTVQFYVLNRRSDRDNKLVCLLDVLQVAGVLVNDNVMRCNGCLTVLPSVVVKQYERVVVGIRYDEQTRRAK